MLTRANAISSHESVSSILANFRREVRGSHLWTGWTQASAQPLLSNSQRLFIDMQKSSLMGGLIRGHRFSGRTEPPCAGSRHRAVGCSQR